MGVLHLRSLGQNLGSGNEWSAQMFEFRSCPRCLGDMILQRDVFGAYKRCFQCGCTVELEAPPPRKRPVRLRSEDDEDPHAA
jgi:hypothetical protein